MKIAELKNGKLVYRTPTQQEILTYETEKAEAERREANREPTAEERIQQLEAQNAMLLECLLEMSEIVYA